MARARPRASTGAMFRARWPSARFAGVRCRRSARNRFGLLRSAYSASPRIPPRPPARGITVSVVGAERFAILRTSCCERIAPRTPPRPPARCWCEPHARRRCQIHRSSRCTRPGSRHRLAPSPGADPERAACCRTRASSNRGPSRAGGIVVSGQHDGIPGRGHVVEHMRPRARSAMQTPWIRFYVQVNTRRAFAVVTAAMSSRRVAAAIAATISATNAGSERPPRCFAGA